jgi:hypothetical protein
MINFVNVLKTDFNYRDRRRKRVHDVLVKYNRGHKNFADETNWLDHLYHSELRYVHSSETLFQKQQCARNLC